MTFPSFTHNGKEVRARGEISLVAKPALDEESGQFFVVREDSIGLDAFAATRESLVREVRDQLSLLWREYALEADSRLTRHARSVKMALLAHFEGVGNA